MATPPSGFARALAYRWLWGCAMLILIADQLSKHWIIGRMPLGSYGSRGLTIFPGFFNLVHVGNTGAAWSMFSGRSTMLAVLALGTLAAIFFWRKHLGLRQTTPQFCFGLLCGGTVGNLIDRLRHGHVTDFLDFHFGDYIFPTFNVADSAICVGVFVTSCGRCNSRRSRLQVASDKFQVTGVRLAESVHHLLLGHLIHVTS